MLGIDNKHIVNYPGGEITTAKHEGHVLFA
jgi:hypothetical protein